MAPGFSVSAPADFLPILKYNARNGRLLCVENTADGRVARDVTDGFAAVMDMDALEVGWMQFGRRTRPDMQLFPTGNDWPEAPSPHHKRGLGVVMQLSETYGGDVRELSSTAGSFLEAFDALHDEFLAGRTDNPGKLPVVVLTGEEAGHRLRFTIAGWVKRTKALVGKV